MPHLIVTTYAGHLIAICMKPSNSFHHGLVTFMACLFRNGVVVGFDSQRFWKSTRCECHRVPESVVGLGSVLADQSRRGVTVIANRHTSMAGFQPAVVVFVHDVTVGAGRRIVGQVRGPASEYERVTSHPSCKANSDTERQPSDGYASKSHCARAHASTLSAT